MFKYTRDERLGSVSTIAEELIRQPLAQIENAQEKLDNLIKALTPLVEGGDQSLKGDDLREALALQRVVNALQTQPQQEDIAQEGATKEEIIEVAWHDLQQLRKERGEEEVTLDPLVGLHDRGKQAFVGHPVGSYREGPALRATRYTVQELCALFLGAGAWGLQYARFNEGKPLTYLALVVPFSSLFVSETTSIVLSTEKGSKQTGFKPNVGIITGLIASALAAGGAFQVAANALLNKFIPNNSIIDLTVFPPQDLFTGALLLLCLKELGGSISSFFPGRGKDREKLKGLVKALKSLLFLAIDAGVVIALEPEDNPDDNMFKYSLLGAAALAGGLVFLNLAEIIIKEISERKTDRDYTKLEGSVTTLVFEDTEGTNIQQQEGVITAPAARTLARLLKTFITALSTTGLSYLLDYIFRHLTKSTIPPASSSSTSSSSPFSSSSSGSTPHQCTITPDPNMQYLGSNPVPIYEHVDASDITDPVDATFPNRPTTLNPQDPRVTCTGNTCSVKGISFSDVQGIPWSFAVAHIGDTANPGLTLANPNTVTQCAITAGVVHLERGFGEDETPQSSSAAYRSPSVVANTMLALTIGYGACQLGTAIWDYLSTPSAEPVDKKHKEYFAAQINALNTQLDEIEASLGQLDKSWHKGAYEEALDDFRHSLDDLKSGKVDKKKLDELYELNLDIEHFEKEVNKFAPEELRSKPIVPMGTKANFFSASTTPPQIEELPPEAEQNVASQGM